MIKKKRTLADINVHNREFWYEIQDKVDPLLSKPDAVDEALDDICDQSRRGLDNVDSLEYALLRNAEKQAKRQSRNAKNRRLRAPSHRKIAIQEMAKARSEKMTYKDFMDSEWDTVSFEVVPGKGPIMYKVYCGELEPRDEWNPIKAQELATKEIADKTIQGWWSEAGKSKS